MGGSALRPLVDRYRDGTTEIRDADGRVISHPNERVFAHLCRLRRALDELEVRLDDEDLRVNVRRARGSLTTFNFLFSDPADHFTGKA